MGKTLVEWLQRVLIIVFAAILALLPVHAFISTWGGTAIGPLLVWKSWKELLLLGLVPVVVLYCLLRPAMAKKLWQHWLTKIAFLYLLLHTIFAITSTASSEAVVAGLLMNLRFIALLLVAEIIVFSGHPWVKRLRQWVPKWLLWTAVGLSVLAILQVTIIPKDFLVQFGYSSETISPYILVDSNPDALRAFATMRGPNPLGAYLLLPIALAVVTLLKKRDDKLAWAAIVLGTTALGFTSSRSAWLGGLVTLGTLALLLAPRRKLLQIIKWSAIPALALGALFLWIALTVPAVRLAIFHSSPTDPYVLEGSNEKHWGATVAGLQDVWQNPLGQGVGTSGPASFYNLNAASKIPENYFVQIAQEVGLAGLALFVAISVIAVYELAKRKGPMPAALLASFAGLTVINVFLHGWADDPTAMTWWGIAGLYLFADNKD